MCVCARTHTHTHTHTHTLVYLGFPAGSDVKESACKEGVGFNPWVKKFLFFRRAWQPTLVFFAGESPWTEEPGGLWPWGHKESDMTE